jgi:hypothetical protein
MQSNLAQWQDSGILELFGSIPPSVGSPEAVQYWMIKAVQNTLLTNLGGGIDAWRESVTS